MKVSPRTSENTKSSELDCCNERQGTRKWNATLQMMKKHSQSRPLYKYRKETLVLRVQTMRYELLPSVIEASALRGILVNREEVTYAGCVVSAKTPYMYSSKSCTC